MPQPVRLILVLLLGACAMLATSASLVTALLLCMTVSSAITTCSSFSDCTEATLTSTLFLGALASAVALILLTLRALTQLTPDAEVESQSSAERAYN